LPCLSTDVSEDHLRNCKINAYTLRAQLYAKRRSRSLCSDKFYVTAYCRRSSALRGQYMYAHVKRCGPQCQMISLLHVRKSHHRNNKSRRFTSPTGKAHAHAKSNTKLKHHLTACIHPSLHHRLLIQTLLPLRPPLLAPREMHNRHRKERVRRLHDTRQHIIPRNKRSNHAEHAARPRQSHVWVSVRGVGRVEVCCSQADERDPYHGE